MGRPAGRQPPVIETLPPLQKKKVLDAILAGQSLRKVAKLAGVSHTVIADYKRRVVYPALKTAAKIQEVQGIPETGGEIIQESANLTRAVIAADPILSRMEQRRLDRERLLKTAEDSADLRGWAAIDRNDISATELEARLTGRLDSQPTGGQVAVVVLPVAGLPGPAAPVAQVLPAGAVRFLPPGEPDTK
jgi:transcriptional regulator with XRE-family HTH domain